MQVTTVIIHLSLLQSLRLDGVVGQLYSYDVNADSYTTPTYSLTTFPAGMTINATTGLIEWTPAPGDGGMDHSVTVEVSNGVTPVATQSFTITVPVPVVVPAGLVAYWHLDEASGNTYMDFTGINDGTGNPSPTATTGHVSGAQQFNGTTTKIDVPASTTFDFAADGDFSVEFWYKGSTPANINIAMGRYITSTMKWFVGVYPNGKVLFYMNDGNSFTQVWGGVIADNTGII